DFDPAAYGAALVDGPTFDPGEHGATLVDDPALRTRASIGSAVKADPERAARAQRVARDTGLPVGVVERNLDYVERKRRAAEIEQAAAESPAVARLFSDPQAAAIAHDDAENLGFLDRMIGAAKRGWHSFVQGGSGLAIGSN